MEGIPPGDALPPPPQRATPARKGARCGAGAGSHARTSRTWDTRVAEPWPPAPEDGRPEDGQRLTPDAPHNGGRPPPAGTAPPPPPRHAAPRGHATQRDSAGPPQPHTRARSTWVADPDSPPSGRAVGGGRAPDLRRPSQQWKASPPGDTLPPPPQRATPARKGARCAAGAGSPPPHRPHPGHTGRGTPAARPRGQAAGGGTAPDTRHPSQQWQATPPGDGPPPPPRHAAPTGHAGQGDSVGPPHPHTRAQSTWVADTNSPPSGRAVGGGTAPDLRRPSQWWKAPPPGTPFRHPHSQQRQAARAHAVGPVLDPHTRTDRTRNTRVAEPWLPAPEDRRLGEGQRLTPDAPHNGGRPPPPGTAPPPAPRHAAPTGHVSQGDSVGPPHPHTRAHSTWVADPNSPPSGRPVGGGTGPDLRRPSQWWKAPPPGTPLRHPHSEQRRPARAHAVGPVLGPQARTDRTRDRRVAEPWLPTQEDRQPGEGQRLTPDAPHNGGRHPPGDALPPPPQRATPARKGARCGARAGSPRPHRPHSGHTGHRTPAARPRERATGRGTAPDDRRPSQRWQATPPWDGPPTTPAARSPHRACRPRGQCWAPTPTRPRPQHSGGGRQQAAQWTGSSGRGSA